MAILDRVNYGAVSRLTLNSPERLNVLSDAMLAAIQEQIEALREDRSIRVIVLNGAGKVFCAGHDLLEMQKRRDDTDGGLAAWQELFERCARVMHGLTTLPQPVIAQVHGIATAAGCQLVASCDLAVASESAKFGVNGVDVGLFCSTPMVALTRKIPPKFAFEMLATGEFIPAQRARELGLVNRVVPLESLEAETDALAARLAGKLGRAVALGKSAFYEQRALPLDKAYAMAGDLMAENMAWDETAKGIDNFFAKRPQEWDQ